MECSGIYLEPHPPTSAHVLISKLFCSFVVVSQTYKKVILPRCFSGIVAEAGKAGIDFLEWLVQFLPGPLESKLTKLLFAQPGNIAIEYSTQKWEENMLYFPSLYITNESVKETDALEQSEDEMGTAQGL